MDSSFHHLFICLTKRVYFDFVSFCYCDKFMKIISKSIFKCPLSFFLLCTRKKFLAL